jgi:hypothetical protein
MSPLVSFMYIQVSIVFLVRIFQIPALDTMYVHARHLDQLWPIAQGFEDGLNVYSTRMAYLEDTV